MSAPKNGTSFMEFVNNSKIVIGTVALVVSSLIGAYNVTTMVFLTKLEAKELYTKHLKKLDSQTSYNKLFIIGQKLDEVARKEKVRELTPFEKRRKNDLIKDYESVSEHIKVLENKQYDSDISKK
jgi:hypothetical protein